MTDIYFSTIKVDGDNKPIFVAADIENYPMIYLVRGRKCFSELGKTGEISIVNNLVPTQQGEAAIGVFLPKLDKCFACDDMHAK